MKLQTYILIALLLISILLNMGGCLVKTHLANNNPSMFYQAYNKANEDNPAPFFLTIMEAQQHCNKMNEDRENEYRIRFIAQ
jgi:hypothetical protein